MDREWLGSCTQDLPWSQILATVCCKFSLDAISVSNREPTRNSVCPWKEYLLWDACADAPFWTVDYHLRGTKSSGKETAETTSSNPSGFLTLSFPVCHKKFSQAHSFGLGNAINHKRHTLLRGKPKDNGVWDKPLISFYSSISISPSSSSPNCFLSCSSGNSNLT